MILIARLIRLGDIVDNDFISIFQDKPIYDKVYCVCYMVIVVRNKRTFSLALIWYWLIDLDYDWQALFNEVYVVWTNLFIENISCI